jgi:hypothetical protein
MSPYEDKDLGLSLLIYMVAILCTLAVFVVPVVLVNGPTVLPNPSAKAARSVLAAHLNESSFPVAHLKEKDIVSPALLTALNAKAKKAKAIRDRAVHAVPRRHEATHPPQRRTYADAAPQRPIGPFGLFFSLF